MSRPDGGTALREARVKLAPDNTGRTSELGKRWGEARTGARRDGVRLTVWDAVGSGSESSAGGLRVVSQRTGS